MVALPALLHGGRRRWGGRLRPQEDRPPAQGASRSAAKPATPAATRNQPGRSGRAQTVPEAKIPGAAPVDAKTYVIGAEDVIFIKVWRDNDVSGQFLVRPDGRISVPLIGDVTASGRTPEQLEKDIAERLSKFIREPQVNVGILSVGSKKYFILGEVNKPGSFPLVVPTNVLEALVNAGGFRDFANETKILILRGNKVFTFNYKQVTRGKKPEQNILLEPGDKIIVK
jgi:polysaccharide export outer membrane protein